MYSLRDKQEKKKRITVIVVIVVLALIFIAGHFGAGRGLASVFHAIVRPFWKNETALVNQTTLQSGALRSKSEILAENEALKAENEKLKIQMSDYQTIKDDNESLKALMGRADKPNFVIASVISKPPHSLYDTLIIDAGSAVGIASGMKIYVDGTVLIGTVSEVYTNSSVVKLFSTSGEKLEVTVSGKNITAEATGRGGGNFEMTFPHDVEIPKGTEVIVPGINPYLVGIVNEIISDPRDPLQKVLMRSPVNMQQLKFVEIEK